jgi:hypothetical protein
VEKSDAKRFHSERFRAPAACSSKTFRDLGKIFKEISEIKKIFARNGCLTQTPTTDSNKANIEQQPRLGVDFTKI